MARDVCSLRPRSSLRAEIDVFTASTDLYYFITHLVMKILSKQDRAASRSSLRPCAATPATTTA
eukprot:15972802-Heterocapsa_arctica.AAC.1